ncbi:hypothetical protein EDB92DRAFT_1874963 [Lactarius akahatsu]|uniref:Uncharacterized protein n=1 Tax=Lactarius akahatsu TaxID=416441 RepID=A0AAD4LBN1_9AGAM|nr:hypothetical protein EDB92DRAFT_1874963 [Lactarius akahatsu]
MLILRLPAARLCAALIYLAVNPGGDSLHYAGRTSSELQSVSDIFREYPSTQEAPTASTRCLRSLVRGGGARRVKAGPQSSKTSHLSLSRRVAQIWRRGIQTSPPFSFPPTCRRSWIGFLRYSIGGSQRRSRVKVGRTRRRPRGRLPYLLMPTRMSILRPAVSCLVEPSARLRLWLGPRRCQTKMTTEKLRPPRGRQERPWPTVYVFNPRMLLPSSAAALETTLALRKVMTSRSNCGWQEARTAAMHASRGTYVSASHRGAPRSSACKTCARKKQTCHSTRVWQTELANLFQCNPQARDVQAEVTDVPARPAGGAPAIQVDDVQQSVEGTSKSTYFMSV